MKTDPTTERLSFNAFSDTTAEHLHRYAITLDFIKQKNVLDIASGEGYGSYLMSKHAKQVYGVDIDVKTIEDAQTKYKQKNLNFLVGSADKIPLLDNSVDVVVSFETIEHHDKHTEMFEEIKRVLNPDGVVIISSPDKKYYSDKTSYNNKFHVKELYFEEFEALVKLHFTHVDLYFQKAFNLNSYIARTDVFDTYKVYSGDQTVIRNQKIEPLYNIAIASNISLLQIPPSIYNGEILTKKRNELLVSQNTIKIKNSLSFRLGKTILKLFKLFSKN